MSTTNNHNNNLRPTLYDYLTDFSYDTDEEYQTELDRLLKINVSNHIGILDELYLTTSNDPLLMKLYTLAAEKQLLQTNPEMGMILLFSYDCFKYFHTLLKLYFTIIVGSSEQTKEVCIWNESNEDYKKIEYYFGKVSDSSLR